MDKTAQLWEIEQIKQLKARYFRLVDTKQWAEFRQVFTDDLVFITGTEQNGQRYDGADAFVKQVSERALRTAISAHHGHMPEIKITSETTASGVWAMFDWVDDPDSGRAFQGYGHYHEDYEKGADGQWRIKRLRLTRVRVDARSPTPLADIRRDSPRGGRG